MPSTPAEHDVADELAIRNLMSQVQQMVDMGEIDEYLDLFTEDAVWVNPGDAHRGVPADTRSGKADIRAGVEERRAAGVQGPGTNTRHLDSTVAVKFDSPDSALVTSYFHYYTDTATTPTLRIMGCYRHTVVRTEKGWKVSRRLLSIG